MMCPPVMFANNRSANATGFTTIPIELPVITIQKLRSVVTVPDGGTVLLGGLKNYDEYEAESGVPFLMKIPILNNEPDRQIILKRTRGYHGVNMGGTSMQGIAANREGWGDLLPHVIEVDPDDIESAARVFAVAYRWPSIASPIPSCTTGSKSMPLNFSQVDGTSRSNCQGDTNSRPVASLSA